MDGNVIFSWEGDPAQQYYVLITTDGKSRSDWYPITGIQHTVKDALLFDSISIRVDGPDRVTDSMTYKGIIYMVNYCNSYRSTLTNNDSSENMFINLVMQ